MAIMGVKGIPDPAWGLFLRVLPAFWGKGSPPHLLTPATIFLLTSRLGILYKQLNNFKLQRDRFLGFGLLCSPDSLTLALVMAGPRSACLSLPRREKSGLEAVSEANPAT